MAVFLRNQIRDINFLNLYDPIDKFTAELMAFFLKNGMTVSAVARQMGITRATVYARLRKYKLTKPDDDDKI